MEENVQYLETKQAFDESEYLYVMDESEEYKETFGKRFLHNEKGELEINFTLEELDQLKKEHPEFIGHKRILNP